MIARWGSAAAGALLVAIGVLSAPLPLFPSMLSVLLGLVLLARASSGMRRWLRAQTWLSQLLLRVKDERRRAQLRRALGLDDT
jgi:uncharacterized membrane protein YbaN (DUF454 family)